MVPAWVSVVSAISEAKRSSNQGDSGSANASRPTSDSSIYRSSDAKGDSKIAIGIAAFIIIFLICVILFVTLIILI